MRGAAIVQPAKASSRITAIYLPTLLVEWVLAIYAIRVGRGRNALGDLLGARWTTALRALEDLAIAFALLTFIEASEAIYASISHASVNQAVLALLPHTAGERLMWVMLASSVGFCEEIVYRGYLLTQLTAFSGAPAVGILVQAMLFGLAHGQQGVVTALRFSIYGIAFGVVAWRRKSLLPGIACHIAIDLSSGLLHH
ncbi:MAG: CPBP family intramembrane glutamic endopeptidase [Polyangiaceae bacterium]